MESSTTFVLDTNVLVDCPRAIDLFGARGNVTIPFMVITELDSLKGNPLVGHAARAARRELIKIFGAPNGELRLKAELESGFSARVVEVDEQFACSIIYKLDIGREHRNDARILATAIDKSSDGPTVVVSGDLWVRFHASKFGLQTEEIEPPREDKPSGLVVVEHASKSVERLGTGQSIIVPQKVAPLYPNQPVKVSNRCGGASAIGIVHADGKRINPLLRQVYDGAFGITPKDDHQRFALHALLSPEIPLVTIEGKAGSGKTLLALIAAKWFWQEEGYDVLITRPLVPAGKESGFLPGKLEKKIGPWMQGVRDNLRVIDGTSSLVRVAGWNGSPSAPRARAAQKESLPEWLDFVSIEYERGASHRRVFLIVDEGQNLTPHEAKTLVTRMGSGSKIILIGDPSQSDLENHHGATGLMHVATRFLKEPLAAHVELPNSYRSDLAARAADLL